MMLILGVSIAVFGFYTGCFLNVVIGSICVGVWLIDVTSQNRRP